jgi:trehalose 6-phosphate phosphatase
MAFDYDGTLADIVEDPADARPHPAVLAGLVALSARVGLVAIVTGRPAAQAVELGQFESADGLGRLVVLGHYGVERWDAATSSLQTSDPPAGLVRVREALPGLLTSLNLGAADVEDKGLSVAVHVRRLRDPADAFAKLEQPLRELAADAGLVAEPGRFVIELRPAGMDKGQALRSLVDEIEARTVVFTGDDLGDLPAFDEVDRLRAAGLTGLLVCSGSTEVTELAERADLVVDGPAGVAAFVAGLVASFR